MDNLFQNLAKHKDIRTRVLILTMVFFSNEKFKEYVSDLLVILAATVGKIINQEGLPTLYTNVIFHMADKPINFHNVYNDYLNRGRIAIMEDYIAEGKNKRKTG